MLKRLAVAVVVLGVAAGAATLARPAAFRVERTASVAAVGATIQAELIDLQRWGAWWPGLRSEEGAQRFFGGPPSGVGATCYWSLPDRPGQGRLTVLDSAPGLVEVEFQFERDGATAAERDLRFTLTAEGAATRVSLVASGADGLLRRALGLVWSRESELGPGLEEALRGLRTTSESIPVIEVLRMERAVSVAAPPRVVLARLADVHRWGAWSPWEAPEVTWTYGGPPTGGGASAYWAVNVTRGKGRLTVVGVAAGKVELEREVPGPHGGSSDHEFLVAQEGEGSRVTWVVSSQTERAAGPGRLAWTDQTLGRDLEHGLARLKALVEGEPRGSP